METTDTSTYSHKDDIFQLLRQDRFTAPRRHGHQTVRAPPKNWSVWNALIKSQGYDQCVGPSIAGVQRVINCAKRAFVVTSTQNHQINILFNIIEIFK